MRHRDHQNDPNELLCKPAAPNLILHLFTGNEVQKMCLWTLPYRPFMHISTRYGSCVTETQKMISNLSVNDKTSPTLILNIAFQSLQYSQLQ